MKREPVDYSKIAETYNKTGVEGACSHRKSLVTFEDGLYRWYCPDCGRLAYGTERAAIALGWIEAPAGAL